MVRIKGANSDYVYTGDSQVPIKEDKNANPLYMKIFICPYDMPSRIEKNDGKICEGTDEDCPHGKDNGKDSSGHAMICLDQEKGISLETNNQVTATGTFVVSPKNNPELLKVSPEGTTVKKTLVIKNLTSKGEQELHLEISDLGVSIQVKNGTKIQILATGDIELSPLDPSKKVKINGNLEVTGGLTAAGKKLA
jgi:hypothetical protein